MMKFGFHIPKQQQLYASSEVLGFTSLSVWCKHFNRGTNCPPLGFQFRVTSKHLLMSIICLKRKNQKRTHK